MNVARALTLLFPDAMPERDYSVIFRPGESPQIARWSLADPQPTEAQMRAALDLAGPVVPVYTISKLTIVRRLEAAGLADAFFAYLDANPRVKRQWDAAQVLRTDDPVLVEVLPVLKAATGATDSQIAGLLSP